MRKIIAIGILCLLGSVKSFAQTNAEVQPATSDRGAVLAPGTQAVVLPADSSAVIMDAQKDVTPSGSAPIEQTDSNSGQPATSVRKPD